MEVKKFFVKVFCCYCGVRFVSSLNPFDGIETAVTHKLLGDEKGDIFLEEQRISLQDAIRAYTLGSAYVNHWEDTMGSLEVGKEADFLILSDNLFALKPEEIHTTRVLETVFRGNVVYEAKSHPPPYVKLNFDQYNKQNKRKK